MNAIENRRIFADDYTSSGQRRWADNSGDGWQQMFLAQLRCDLIASERVIVPDTHLLDGCFFAAVGPAQLLESLGAQPRLGRKGLEVRARRPSLKESLAYWLVRPGSATLNPFPFKLFADEGTRSVVADLIGETLVCHWHGIMSKEDGNPAKALAGLLREVLDRAPLEAAAVEAASCEIAGAEEAWAQWQEIHDDGFYLERWDGSFDLAAALAEDPIEADLSTAQGRDLHLAIVDAVRQGQNYRSDANAMIADVDPQDDQVQGEIASIEKWYSRARYRAIANQHSCAFAFTTDKARKPREVGNARLALQRLRSDHQIVRLPDEFFEAVASASNEEFGRALSRAQGQLQPWWHAGDLSSLRRAVDSICVDLEVRGATGFPPFVQTYIKRGAAVAGAAAVALGHLMEAPLVTSVIGIGGPLAERFATGRVRRRVVEALRSRTGQTSAPG